MNNNMIYRQDAINSIKELPRWIMDPNGEFQPVDPPTVSMIDPEDAVSAIENLPPAQLYSEADIQKIQDLEQAEIQKAYELGKLDAEPQWIPCSERLPEVGTYVLVSKKSLGFRSNLPNVCTAHRSRDPRSGKEEWNDMLFGKLDDDDVLAWMPLPEPYGGEQDESD